MANTSEQPVREEGVSEIPVVELVGVRKAFGEQVVLDEVSWKAHRHKITFIIGKSGTGKSVTLKHIIGLLKPDAGKVLVEGLDITKLSAPALNRVRRKFGMLFQGAALFDSMNVMDNVAFPLREHTKLSRKQVTAKVREKLDQVGLENVEHKFPAELSGGMRKRVGLARAIILDPEIILYDEPTTGLDPLMTEQVDRLIADTHHQQRATSIVISHDISSVFRIADQVVVLHEGKALVQGAPDEVRAVDHPFIQKFIANTVG